MESLNSRLLYFIKLDCLLLAPAASAGEKSMCVSVSTCRLFSTVSCDDGVAQSGHFPTASLAVSSTACLYFELCSGKNPECVVVEKCTVYSI